MPTRKQILFFFTLVLVFAIVLIVSRIMHQLLIKKLIGTNANLQAFLMTIRKCEGTAGANGYRTIMGYCLFDDFSKHPNRKCVPGGSTAAGAYQFIYATWKGLQRQLLLPDFSPASQDAAAVQLIMEKKAFDDVVAGRIEAAVRKLSNTWESFTYGKTNQPHKSLDTIKKYFTDAGGTLA